MAESKLVLGSTFEEMLHPWQIDPAIRAKAQQMNQQAEAMLRLTHPLAEAKL